MRNERALLRTQYKLLIMIDYVNTTLDPKHSELELI